MATPTYATNMTLITAAESSSGFTAVGGGGSLVSGETDFFVEGSACLSKNTAATWDSSSTPRGGALFNNGSGVTIPTDGAAIFWIYWWAPGVLDVEANGGMEIDIGNSTTAYYGFNVRGSDTYQFSGWIAVPVDPNESAGRDRTVGSPSGTWQYFGWQAYVLAAASVGKGAPWGCDVIRYGRCDIVCTNGESGAYASFGGNGTDGGAAAYDNSSTRRWGLLTPKDGAFFQQGLFQMGSSGTVVDFRDSNRVIFIQDVRNNVSANFNRFDIQNASSRVDWTAISFQALGTHAKGYLTVTDNADVNIDSCNFTDMDTFTFKSGSSVLDSTFRRCGAITAGDGDFRGSSVLASSVAADASALIWDTGGTVDTDGKLDNMTFSKGALAHHAIQLGDSTNLRSAYTLRGIAFGTGFNASNANNDSTLYIPKTTGSVTINLVGCTGNISYKTGGAAVTIVNNPVTTGITVVDSSTGSPISGVRVLVEVASAIAGFPYLTSTTITRSGSTATATVASTAALTTGDWVSIKGANQAEYNGTHQITVATGTTFTFTVSGTPTTPATGTITTTFNVISGTTDGSGYISSSYVFSSSQPITGRARKSSSAPYYKTSPISGTVDSSAGFTATVQMIPDS